MLCGLGSSGGVEAIEVRWPDGSRERWSGAAFPVNGYHTLMKGTGQAYVPRR